MTPKGPDDPVLVKRVAKANGVLRKFKRVSAFAKGLNLVPDGKFMQKWSPISRSTFL